MNIASGLLHLGFESGKDFLCVDKSDGKGPYLAEWYSDKPQPSEKQIADAVTAYEAQWDAQEYARKREAEYPSIKELVVAIYDPEDMAAIEARRAAVKAKYPKRISGNTTL